MSLFYRAIAMKYLCKAARLGNQDATAQIQAIDTYTIQIQDQAIADKVAELQKQSKRRESSTIMIPYQML